jgi:hypothetical protein
MPTKPPDSLFDQDYFRVQIVPVLNIASPLIEELRNYGLAVLARCAHRPEGGDENLPVLLTYLHLLEMLDAVAILVSESSIIPAKLLTRSMFEAVLVIEYVLQKDTVRRGLAYVFMDVVSRLKSLKRLDSETPEGEAFRKSLGDYASVIERLRDQKSKGLVSLNDFLEKDELKDIREEYTRLSKRKEGRLSWYQFFKGPRDIRGVARAVGREAEYAVLYSYISGTVHVEDVVRRRLAPAEGDKMGLRPLREPTDIMLVLNMSITYALRAIRKVLEHYRPAELPRNKEWYLSEIKPRWNKLQAWRAEQVH